MCELTLMKDIKVLIVDDDLDQLENLKSIIGGAKGMAIVGAFSDPAKAMDSAPKIEFDVMITDLAMPGMSGVDLIRRVRNCCSDVEIIALSAHDEITIVFNALKAGATGYILKSSTDKQVIDAVSEAARGGSPITPKVARSIIMDFQSEARDAALQLSPREKEILRKIETGCTYKEVAEHLNLSAHTVHWYLRKVFEKLHARSKQEAVYNAKKLGLL
ncbi:MAG: response regulator transcription factor [Nitrospinae bacterium]|nr:response regulator transcription factor [Nitrospinota bacterium]